MIRYAYVNRQCVPYLDEGVRFGSVPPILFIHGWGVSPWAYRDLLNLLAVHHRVVAPFLPILTWNPSRTPILSHQDWATLLVGFCTQIGMSDAHVIGQSTGGGVAACLASGNPSLARTLTVIDASGVPGHIHGPFALHLLAAAVFDVAQHLIDVRYPIAQSRLALSFLANLACSNLKLINAAQIPLFENLTQHYASIAVPTLVLWGEKDVLFPVAAARELHALVPNAALHVVERGYHLWEIKRPQIAADKILELTARHV